MKHDYEKARRGSVIQSTGKTRVTMYLDDDVIDHFRKMATEQGRGYQTEINACLRQAISRENRIASNRKSHHDVIQRVVIKELSASAFIAFDCKAGNKMPAFLCKSKKSKQRYLEQA